ncbi:MAG TPA: hypothetical protein VM029_11925 [Opitutaceae bacterium]|nr:hypothetical protein [Opitutaceae bacterium]
MTSRFAPLQRVALAICLFLVIWGAKLYVIDQVGSDLPFWDQWAKEGEGIYPAYFERGELWRNVIKPHNEHRIAPTLLLNLGLVLAGGQWDARVQSMASGAVHAAVLIGLFLWTARRVSRGWAAATAVLLALIGGTPIAWENIVCGFQSQFYFLAGFSLLALGGLLGAPAFSLRWFGGAVAAFIAIVSMGSGFLCAAPIIVIALLRLVQGRGGWRDAVATLLVGIGVAALGVALHTTVPWHAGLHARTPTMLLRYALRCLAWPRPEYIWVGVVLWLPWGVLAVRWMRGLFSAREPTTNPSESSDADFIIASGAWILAQIVAVSYARGAGAELPSSRYEDLFALGTALSFIALALSAPRWRRPVIWGAAWLAMATAGVAVATRDAWQGPLQGKKTEHRLYEHNVQQFVLTDDFSALENQTIPFPLADWLARVLRLKTIQRILPVSVRAPVAIAGLGEPAAIAAPPLPHRATRAMLRPGEWRSGPLPAGRGWWKIETAGHLGEPGALLALVALDDNRTLDSIAPSKLAGNTWRAAYVRAPAVPALLVARTDDAARWFAFSEPSEMSVLSYDSWQLARQGPWLALTGALAGLAIAFGWRQTA